MATTPLRINYVRVSSLVIENRRFENEVVHLNQCTDIVFRNCCFVGSGVVAHRCTNIRISYSTFYNSVGLNKHAIQFDKCTLGYIGFNTFEETNGESQLSDVINLFTSNGTLENPIVVEHNYISGGGPHLSGGGIMLGDNMGDYQVARYNVLFQPGQYGIAVAGGNNHQIHHNWIVSPSHPWSNVGIYVWGIPQRGSTVDGVVVLHNKVHWFSGRHNLLNGFWKGPNTVNITVEGNQFRAPFEIPPKPHGVGCCESCIIPQ